MTDETFRLTPLDVRRWPFKAAMRGYDKDEVERFREQVADEMDRLTRVNQELEAKAKAISEQLRGFRERDTALNEALISAQQLRAEIREQAEREQQLILREARAEAERLVEATKGEIRRLQEEVVALERSRRAFLSQMRQLIERQLAGLEAAEGAPPTLPGTGGGEGGRQPQATPAWLDSLMKE
jgi:DivIVA domain-containing protein